MKTVTLETEGKVQQLLAILEEDIRRSEKTLNWLDQLRGMVIKRDDAGLNSLLTEIQGQGRNYKNSDSQLHGLRREIARNLGCNFKQVTLTRLQGELSGQMLDEANKVKENLQNVCLKLRKEHAATVMLINECARFNKLLLQNILEICRTDTVTYDTKGLADRDGRAAFMNLQF